VTGDDFNIDELLNGFIDGELSARQQTELQRLLSHDAEIAERLRRLQRCRMLVNSLPREKAPAGLVEDVKATLERRALWAHSPDAFDEQKGTRGLLLRKVTAAAAMILLAAVLGAVIYVIMAPERRADAPAAVDTPRVTQGQRRVRPAAEVAAVKQGQISSPEAEGGLLVCRLHLTAEQPQIVSAYVRKIIESAAVLNKTYPGNSNVCSVVCSRGQFRELLADMEGIWARLDSARLFIDSSPAGEQIVVETITAEQIAGIAARDNLPDSLKAAKQFAAFNAVARQLPGKKLLAAARQSRQEMLAIPKPVLTSGERSLQRAADAPDQKKEVCLIIVVNSR